MTDGVLTDDVLTQNPLTGDPLSSFSAIVGTEHVLTGSACEFFAHDVYRAGICPLAVVSPGGIDELQRVVAAASKAGFAILPRGGGASYTDGYLTSALRAILIDCRRLDRIVEINEEDMFVTVEPGITWAALTAALAARGLRTPFFGPFSGLVATVGGSVSQNSTSHGAAAYGGSAESVIALEIVLASGEMLRTGQAGSSTGQPFYRFYGPDLTGLFTGDCGALGIKARVTLRLIRRPAASLGVSFAFASFDAFHEASAKVAAESLDDENFGLDRVLSQGQIARNESTERKLDLIRQVVRTAPTPVEAVRRLFRLATTDPRVLERAEFFMHYIVTGHSPADAKSKADILRRLASRHGKEIANTVPVIVESMPFAPLFNILGPKGERWVPLHGVLPHSRVKAFHRAASALFARYRADMKRLRVHHGLMFVTIGTGAFLYELALYWEDERAVFHDTMLDPSYLETLPVYAANPDGTRLVEQLKTELIEIFHRYGAAHFQVGKAYPLLRDRNPQAVRLLRAIKSALDPQNLINPANLGL